MKNRVENVGKYGKVVQSLRDAAERGMRLALACSLMLAWLATPQAAAGKEQVEARAAVTAAAPNPLEFLLVRSDSDTRPFDTTFVSTTQQYVVVFPEDQTFLAAYVKPVIADTEMDFTLELDGQVIPMLFTMAVQGSSMTETQQYAEVTGAFWDIPAAVTGTLVISSYDEQGRAPIVYTVTIGRAAAAPNPLEYLAVGSENTGPAPFDTPFVSTTKQYAVALPAGQSDLMMAAKSVDDAGHPNMTFTLKLSGTLITPGFMQTGPGSQFGEPQYAEMKAAAWSIQPGVTGTLVITSYDAGGTIPTVYTVTIGRVDPNASADDSLAALTITPGVLRPAFVSNTTQYGAVVLNGTTTMMVTATPNDGEASVAYESSAGACGTGAEAASRVRAGGRTCPIAAPKTWITMTVTAANGDVQQYFIVVTVAGPLATIDRLWPGSGVPSGGMPVQIFGSGFVEPLTVTVGPYEGEMVVVTPTAVRPTRIDFVMPPGTAGQYVSVTVATAEGEKTAASAFLYVQPVVLTVDASTGGVFVTADGLTVTVPSQGAGITGTFLLTMTPQPPQAGVPGNVLMYSFRLDAALNGTPLAVLTNAVTIQLPIDEGIFAIQDGERPWLYQWTADGGRPTAAGTMLDGGQRSMDPRSRPAVRADDEGDDGGAAADGTVCAEHGVPAGVLPAGGAGGAVAERGIGNSRCVGA